jgi:stage V sporulation protein D (sporulation-specific penicillin-binding protein)
LTEIVIRKRLTQLLFLVVLITFLLIGRLTWLQIVRGEELEQGARENRIRNIEVEAKRGDICDRNGKVLVTSVSCESVVAMPAQVNQPEETARKLAAVLEMDKEEILERITKRQSFIWIKRKVDFETSKKVRALRLNGIELIEESRRQYNRESLAAHILGFAGIDNQGLTGLEKTYDKELCGTPGEIVIEQDAAGRDIPTALHQLKPPVSGNNLILTIDETVQYFVERELDKIVDSYQPASAAIIVMDPKTGEILALGNRPTFAPDRWSEAPKSVWDRNPAIWQLYEPGSTYKIVTAAAGLSENTVKPENPFYCPGFIKVADRNIRCWKAGGHGSLSFAEVVENSCNPGFIKVALDLGRDRFYKYIKAFGFGQPTGIDLPGEAKGILIPQDKATNLNVATMAIGQSIAITPIQLAVAMAAIANGGEPVRPHLVRQVTSHDGKVVRAIEPERQARVMTADKAHELGKLLESVVVKGTGVNAYLDGYRTAGKTGTAQVVGASGGYVAGRYVASFIGFAPVDDPRLVTLVVIWEPQGGAYYGGVVAAPVFKAVMQDALRYLGVPQQAGLEKPEKPWYLIESEPEPVTVPGVVNLPLEEAVASLRAAGLNFTLRGDGDVVREQVPQGGATVLSGTRVVLQLKSGPENGKAEVTVPDLTGLTIKDAAILLEKIGLTLTPSGSGIAVEQKPAPKTKLRRGAAVKVQFNPPEEHAEEQELMALHP